MTKNPILLSILFFSISINAQEVSEEDIFQFRNLLKSKKFHDAEVLIERFDQLGMDEPKLELLETELWIEKADDLYSRKQYKSAFPYYNNAYLRWRSNPKIKERYNELTGKILVDEETQKKIRKQIKEEDPKEVLVHESDTHFNNIINENIKRIDKLEDHVRNLTYILLIFLLLNSALLILKLKK